MCVQTHDKIDKKNVDVIGNDKEKMRVYVDMKKKIKKPQKKKVIKLLLSDSQQQNKKLNFSPQNQPLTLAQLHTKHIKQALPDETIILDNVFRSKIIDQRIDNDIDSEDEQISAGIRRLSRALSQTIQIQKQEEIRWAKMQQLSLNIYNP